MASGGGKKQQFPSKTSKETCVFCDRLELQQNMKRHITQYCEVARAECAGLDVMKEAEKRSAKRKGLVGVKTMFQSKPKSAKTGTVDREELLMDDDDAQMDTDELNNQLLNLDETLEADTNVVHHEPNPIDERILEKLDNMSIGIGEGFNSVCERLNRLEKEKGKELPPIARPEDIGPVDERSWDLNKCVSLDDILQLLVEMKLEEEDGVPLIYCSLCCPENGVTGYLTEEKNKCAWPLLHKDLKTLELYGTYMGGEIERDYPDRLRNTRFSFQVQNRERAETVSERVTEKMEALAKQMHRDLKDGVFTEEVSEAIELIRELSDLRELAAKVREHGAVSVGLMLGENFVVNVRKLTNSVDHIPTEALKECYQNFLKAFEKYIEDKEVDNIDSKTVIKDFMKSDDKLYLGNEVIIHCLLALAVKYSVESSVESLISRYEVHFDKSRQLGEEKAHMEMFVSQNGPVLVRADPLLKRAMDKFFKDKNPRGDGAWNMYHSDETRFYPQDESRTMKRLQKEKSKLGFVDA